MIIFYENFIRNDPKSEMLHFCYKLAQPLLYNAFSEEFLEKSDTDEPSE